MSQLARWILSPAPEHVLRDLHLKGFAAADRWIQENDYHLPEEGDDHQGG